MTSRKNKAKQRDRELRNFLKSQTDECVVVKKTIDGMNLSTKKLTKVKQGMIDTFYKKNDGMKEDKKELTHDDGMKEEENEITPRDELESFHNDLNLYVIDYTPLIESFCGKNCSTIVIGYVGQNKNVQCLVDLCKIVLEFSAKDLVVRSYHFRTLGIKLENINYVIRRLNYMYMGLKYKDYKEDYLLCPEFQYFEKTSTYKYSNFHYRLLTLARLLFNYYKFVATVSHKSKYEAMRRGVLFSRDNRFIVGETVIVENSNRCEYATIVGIKAKFGNHILYDVKFICQKRRIGLAAIQLGKLSYCTNSVYDRF
jgi:hypothetical protein